MITDWQETQKMDTKIENVLLICMEESKNQEKNKNQIKKPRTRYKVYYYKEVNKFWLALDETLRTGNFKISHSAK